MVRTLALAGLVMLFGVTASQAQYTDSGPPPDVYASEYETYDGYDYELLGDPQEYGHGYSEPDVDVGIFAGLGSDGRWFFAADFGWVWRPYAAAGWRPYSQGRWVWTSHGWTWVSYEPFGWATYHYGYWACDTALGWVWIPGYEWAACRVQWAYYDNYVSWAPLPPPGYYCPQPWTSAGFSVWFTVGADRFCDPYPTRYCVTSGYPSVYRERVAYKSFDRHHIERYTGSSIHTATVKFKNTTWSRGDGSAASYSGSGGTKGKRPTQDYVSMKSTKQKSGTRTLATAQRSGGSDRKALKTQSRKQDTRQFSTQGSREGSRKVASTTFQTARRKQDTRSTRDIVESKKGVSGKEWRTARAERRSQVQMERKSAPRQERVQQQSTRSATRSKQFAQTRKSSAEPRKNVASAEKSSRVEKSSRRESRESNVKRWESGSRGQGKKK